MKISKFIRLKQEEAVKEGKEEAASILLLEHVLDVNPSELYLKMDCEMPKDLEAKYNKLYSDYLYKNKPIQHIIGYSTFYGYDFIVNEDVLIPRRETEELVENILYRYDDYFKGKKVDVCDLATGSGNIAITLALEEPNMNVIATDISAKALDTARRNNEKLGANVKFIEGDMLEPVKDMKFDIFVSNPPYIPNDELVDPLVKDNEPNIALFGGSDGMKFYDIILRGVGKLLKDKAIIAFEHGFDKKEEMIELSHKYFPNSKVEVLKDLEGKDRMTFIYVGDFKW